MTGSVDASDAGGVVTITLSNRGKRNAITREMYDTFETLLRQAASDDSVRAVVLRGADGAFAGGTDIQWLTEIVSGDLGVEYEAHMRRVQTALIDLDVPVISVVDGACVGGGIVLAALSDIVLATPASRFGSPIARTVGNTLSPTSISRLTATFGRRVTAEMLFTARLFTAEEALAAGFLTDMLPPKELEVRLVEILEGILHSAPLTLRSFRRLWRRLDAAAAVVPADDVYAEIYGSDDFAEGVRSFLAKRSPNFGGS